MKYPTKALTIQIPGFMNCTSMHLWRILPLALLFLISCGKELPLLQEAKTYEIQQVNINGILFNELEGVVNDSLVLTQGHYLVKESLIVNEDGTLILGQGVNIYFEKNPDNNLIIERGGKLDVNGTFSQPVVLTSLNEIYGNAAAGDWGGVHINGNAGINDRNETLVGIIGNYGKTSNAVDGESSGNMQYMRIQYGGSAQRNIGGALNLNGIGSSTRMENIQVYQSKNHGLRIRGGAPSMQRLVITHTLGTSLRWEEGWRGKIQQMVIHQQGAVTDTVTFIRGESGSKTEQPFSSPKISNFTIVGWGDNTRGIRLEDQTRCILINGLIAHTERAIRTDALDSLIMTGDVRMGNTILFDNKINFYDHENGKTSLLNTPQNAWYKGTINLDGYIGSLASGAINAQEVDNWFLPLMYMGGVQNGSQDWTQGWTKK